MKRRRLELPRHNCHYPLKVARLPIPPPLQLIDVPRTGLEPARRETHAPETCASTNSATWALPNFQRKSGKRDSDPRPQPWQGCALPTELFPQSFCINTSISLNAGAKVSTFTFRSKYFLYFFKKTHKKNTHPNVFTLNPCDFYSLRNQIRAYIQAYRPHGV